MPSDNSLQIALAAVAPRREAFHSAVAAAAEQIAARLQAVRTPANGREERAAIELGTFAAGRVDADRFSALFGADEVLDPHSLGRLDRAHEMMSRIAGSGDDIFVLRHLPGTDLRAGVAAALAEAGRAFAAARSAENVRLGRYPADEVDFDRDGFPVRRWNRAERQIAPPLVVELEGGDLQAGGLAEFLAGEQKIVLLVRGNAPAAPLARLITPNVFVMQTTDADELSQLLATEGPAIAALLPEGAARFVHRPVGGRIWDRLQVTFVPEHARASVGAVSHFQQEEELAQLRVLAIPPPPAPVAAVAGAAEAPASPPADPVDQLASWLLAQSGLDGGGAGEARS